MEMIAEKKSKMKWLRWLIKTKIIWVLLIVVALCLIALGLKDKFSTENNGVKLGFEDIGELATQTAYCTQVNVTEAARELFGVEIPFTQSKYIYSYNVILKAGLNFQEIKWTADDTAKTIKVWLPEVQILSAEPDMDSFNLYLEDESIFRQIRMEENNEALKKMVKNARKDAIGNGLLEAAKENAQVILTGFFSNRYDMNEYKIEFLDQ